MLVWCTPSLKGIEFIRLGSGCVLDALRLQKALIVVPNPSLLHGHQAELASALENRGYLRTSTLSYVMGMPLSRVIIEGYFL